ncbi:MAG: phosphoribosylformylglycinamidine synthase subunit PurL, partial [Chloroflexi bacterium]|nr:phosphoribosylformylglycinamidine synthase subunit PurL [Chloroflexota bacterium]
MGTQSARPDLNIPREVGLTDHEADLVRKRLDAEPNPLEWAMFGAMWSEHCAYKHSRRLLKTLPTTGARVALGPGENAGAIDLGDGLLCAFKVESHNHPSAVEPYQGAATGVGGILRDVFAMGAWPIAILDGLCFGDPSLPRTRSLVKGVVGGISFYGNCVGIPNVGGHVSFEPTYNENPLVNAMCVGLVTRDKLASAATAKAGSAVYLVGSDTGRDGIAGASLLASFELGTQDDAKRPSVQVGNPFLEKLLMEATLELVQSGAVEAVQDLGAAGLTCATSEVAARSKVGMRVDLDKVPRRATGMLPFEVMLSESQERMLVIAKPGREAEVERVFAHWELHGARIGVTTAEPVLEIVSEGKVVASLPPAALADDAPAYDLAAAVASFTPPAPSKEPDLSEPVKVSSELLALLGSPAVASRKILYRTYDSMVGTNTVIGPGADGAVLRIKGRPDGIGVSLDAQPRVAALDPYVGGAAAVAEATRNLVVAGVEPLAITDCLNLGNPEKPEGAWRLARTIEGIGAACRALGTPIVSGNVSLYNSIRVAPDPASPGAGEPQSKDIWPTAMVGAVGRIADVTTRLQPRTGEAGDVVLLAGSADVRLGASAYGAMRGVHAGAPAIDLELEVR